jgi:hypothetical protein
MSMSRPAHHIVLMKICGFLFFLILLAVANVIIPSVNKGVYTDIVMFFNTNITFLFLITLIGMVNELFWNFHFPFNVPAPITGGVLSIYVVMFFYRVWNFLDEYINSSIRFSMGPIYVCVFLITALLGYVTILSRQGKTRTDWEEEVKRRGRKMKNNLKEKDVEWKDVENQFRLVFYNIGRSINKLFEKKEKRR